MLLMNILSGPLTPRYQILVLNTKIFNSLMKTVMLQRKIFYLIPLLFQNKVI